MFPTGHRFSKTESTLPVFELHLDDDESDDGKSSHDQSVALEFSDFSRESIGDENERLCSLADRIDTLESHSARFRAIARQQIGQLGKINEDNIQLKLTIRGLKSENEDYRHRITVLENQMAKLLSADMLSRESHTAVSKRRQSIASQTIFSNELLSSEDSSIDGFAKSECQDIKGNCELHLAERQSTTFSASSNMRLANSLIEVYPKGTSRGLLDPEESSVQQSIGSNLGSERISLVKSDIQGIEGEYGPLVMNKLEGFISEDVRENDKSWDESFLQQTNRISALDDKIVTFELVSSDLSDINDGQSISCVNDIIKASEDERLCDFFADSSYIVAPQPQSSQVGDVECLLSNDQMVASNVLPQVEDLENKSKASIVHLDVAYLLNVDENISDVLSVDVSANTSCNKEILTEQVHSYSENVYYQKEEQIPKKDYHRFDVVSCPQDNDAVVSGDCLEDKELHQNDDNPSSESVLPFDSNFLVLDSVMLSKEENNECDEYFENARDDHSDTVDLDGTIIGDTENVVVFYTDSSSSTMDNVHIPLLDSHFATEDKIKPIHRKESVFSRIRSNVTIDDSSARLFLGRHGWPQGLQDTFLSSVTKCPIRYMILDDSKSMGIMDGKYRVDGQDILCSRWQELFETMMFHAKLSYEANLVTEFRLLNGSGPLVIDKNDIGLTELERFLEFSKLTPAGRTPLCAHISEIERQVSCMKDSLVAHGHKAVLFIATDGESSDGDILSAMRPLKDLPVWIVVRLCTNNPRVVNYWNRVKAQLNLDIEVLDDFSKEAAEVSKVNPWLTYAEPLHRVREFGIINEEFALLDEKPLSKMQLHRMLIAILGNRATFLPDPEKDWPSFCDAVLSLTHSEEEVWCTTSISMKPWVVKEYFKEYPSTISHLPEEHREKSTRSLDSFDLPTGKAREIATGRRHSVGVALPPSHPSSSLHQDINNPVTSARRPSLFKKQSTYGTPGLESSDAENTPESIDDWEEKFDKKSDRRYWKNKITGKTQWKNPFTGIVDVVKENPKRTNRHSVSFPLVSSAGFETISPTPTTVAGDFVTRSALKRPESEKVKKTVTIVSRNDEA